MSHYSFELEWNELPADLREQKVTKYLVNTMEDNAHRYAEEQLGLMVGSEAEQVELRDAKYEEFYDAVIADPSLVLEDLHFREEAEYNIEHYFPMYF